MRQVIIVVSILLLLPTLAGCLLPGILDKDAPEATIRIDWTQEAQRFLLEFKTPQQAGELTLRILDFSEDRPGAALETIAGNLFEARSATRYAVTPRVFEADEGRYKLELFVNANKVSERAITVSHGHVLDVEGLRAHISYQVSHEFTGKTRQEDTAFLAHGSVEEKPTNRTSRVAYGGSAASFTIHSDEWVANGTAHDITLVRDNGFITNDRLTFDGTWMSRRQFDTQGRVQDGGGSIRIERTFLGPTMYESADGFLDAYVSREWMSRLGQLQGPPTRAILEHTLTYLTKDAATGRVLAYEQQVWENSTNAYASRSGEGDPRPYPDPFNAGLVLYGPAPRELRLGDRFQKTTPDGEVIQFEASKRNTRPFMNDVVDVVQVDGRSLLNDATQILMFVRTSPEMLNEPFPIQDGVITEYREYERMRDYESTRHYRLASFILNP